MKTVIFDTNILIDHLKGKQEAHSVLLNCIGSKNLLACSLITKIELLSGIRPDEEKVFERFINGFEMVALNNKIAIIAGSYMSKFRKSHGINIADAIIAASTKAEDALLYTLNTKHYPMADIEVVKPY